MSNQLRLQKFIADCGITSRRKAEDLIVQGRVQVNGQVVRELGTKVDVDVDTVVVDGKLADLEAVNQIYLVMNKPRGCVTTLNDPEGRKTVMDYCKEVSERIYPVGRLDYLSEGLLILTNDGQVANMIMHPSFDVTKVYEVKLFGSVNEGLLKKLRAGVHIDGDFVKPKSVRVIEQLKTKTWVEFRLTEGKNREIRRICEACGVTIDKLKRVAIEGITCQGIAPGNFGYMTKPELLRSLGLDENGVKVRDMEYRSAKKTVNLKKKPAHGTKADDSTFVKFRKDTYFQTLKDIKRTKAEKEQREKLQAYAEKEKAFQERKRKKEERLKKKAELKQTGVHAEFVK